MIVVVLDEFKSLNGHDPLELCLNGNLSRGMLLNDLLEILSVILEHDLCSEAAIQPDVELHNHSHLLELGADELIGQSLLKSCGFFNRNLDVLRFFTD